MTFQEYLIYELKTWKNHVVPFLEKNITNPVKIVDVGCSAGVGLISLANSRITTSLTGIEPYFQDILKKIEPTIHPLIYPELHIEIIEKNGATLEDFYQDFDLIIKTFNPFVNWDYIIDNCNSSFLLTSGNLMIYSPKYELIDRLQTESNTYFLYKRKDS